MTLIKTNTRSTNFLKRREFATNIERHAMISYTDDLERMRRYLFQYYFLLEHSKSVFR